MDLQEIVHAEHVRYLVSRTITCPRTGEVLDVRTCVVLLDSDGDPLAVLSQAGWAELDADDVAHLARRGWTVDPATVKA